jgi:hypothetical protein
VKFEPIGGSVETPAPAKPEPPPPVVAAAPPEKLPAHLLPPPKNDAVVQQAGGSLPALAVEAVVLWLGQTPRPVRMGAICRPPPLHQVRLSVPDLSRDGAWEFVLSVRLVVTGITVRRLARAQRRCHQTVIGPSSV